MDPTSSKSGPPTLSRRQLTLAMVFLTLVPPLLAVALYVSFPVGDDPVLEVEAEVGPRAWPAGDASEARLLPCLILRNPTDQPWKNVSLSINEQYHFYHPDAMQPGEEIVVPLRFFTTSGSRYFRPESQPLELLTVYAQIPTGARAIRKIEASELKSDLDLAEEQP